MRDYYVYIMTNNYATLYTGIANDLERRVAEHKRKLVRGFTSRYNITRLVYYEVFGDAYNAHRQREADQGMAEIEEGGLD